MNNRTQISLIALLKDLKEVAMNLSTPAAAELADKCSEVIYCLENDETITEVK